MPTAGASSFAVEVDPTGLDASRADPARLRQLVANLLDNAVRHSPTGGTVPVRRRVDDGRWRLEVADEGPGVPPADRERAFERFGTLAATRRRRRRHRPRAGHRPLGRRRCTAAPIRLRRPDPAGPGAVSASTCRSPARATRRRPEESRYPTRAQRAVRHAPRAVTRPGAAAGRRHRPSATRSSAGSGRTRRGRARPALVGAVACGRARRAVVLPYRDLGPGAASSCCSPPAASVLRGAAHRRDPFTLTCLALALCARLPVVLLGTPSGSSSCACSPGTAPGGRRDRRPRAAVEFVLAGVAWPLAGLRGLPWLGRTLRARHAASGSAPRVLLTALWSALGGAGLRPAVRLGRRRRRRVGRTPSSRTSRSTTFVLRVFIAVAVGGADAGGGVPRPQPAGRRRRRAGGRAVRSRTASSGWCRCCSSTWCSRCSSPRRRR